MYSTATSRNLRIGRHSEHGRIYAVTISCYQRRPLFETFSAGRLVVAAMQAVQSMAITLCFVVMPDHVHWLMLLQEEGDLSASVQKFKAHASRQIHANTAYKAQVWDRGFYDRAIRKEEDLKAIARYIILNPLRAGLAQRIGDYPLWDAVWL